MTEPVTEDIRRHSVTAGDVFDYAPGSGGVASFVLPFFLVPTVLHRRARA